jgi:hypothetical protein
MVFVISLTQHRNASTSRSLLPSPRRCAGMVRQTSPSTLPWLPKIGAASPTAPAIHWQRVKA